VSDRFLTLQMGVLAAKAAINKDWNKAVVSRHGEIILAPIAEIMKAPRLVPTDDHLISYAQSLGIFI
jgi:hypothetical protein